MDGPIVGYVRICEWPFAHDSNLDPIWTQKMFFDLIFQEFCDFLGPGTYVINYS